VSERNGARRHPLEFLSAAAILAACAGCPQYRDASVPNEIARAVAPDGDAAYLLYVPSTYDREHTWPLVILCHGTKPWDTPLRQMKDWVKFAEERGCALIVLMNKWDLVDTEERREELAYEVEKSLGFVSYAPLIRLSALTGAKVGRVFQAIDKSYAAYTRQITTSALNRLLTEMREFGHTVSKGGQTLRLHYVTQTRTEPPGFTFFANKPRLVDDSFERYIENRMREAFDLEGTPIRLRFRPKD